MAENEGAPKKSAPPRPTIALPPRDNFFLRGANASPGPMTLVSNFFSENDPDSECRSFSQLLAGAMSPGVRWPKSYDNTAEAEPLRGRESGDGAKEEGFRSKQIRPMGLVMAQSPGFFTIPAGLSPGGFLDSPSLFSPVQGHFGMISHQQALAQVTAQAAQSQSHMHIQTEFPSSITPATSASSSYSTHPAVATIQLQQNSSLTSSGGRITTAETTEVSYSDQRSQPSLITVDKPTDDGYNWRKYGQKQVKGSEYPRSYYKCSHPNCPVKKKVERSADGQVTEIIYKGEHNHQQPQQNRRAKEVGLVPSGLPELNGRVGLPASSEMGSQNHTGNFGQSEENFVASSVSRRDHEPAQVAPEQLSGSSDGEEVAEAEVRTDAGDDNEPDLKRRCTEVKVTESTHRTVTEPRIIVQTTSEVDLLDDGYRWRKYGQKVVKGNPHPRSYYKCTNVGCSVRKHVERASTDPKAVMTTYEGKHNHDVPVARNSSHNTAHTAPATDISQLKACNTIANKHTSVKGINLRNDNAQQPVSLVRMKEEREII